MVGHKTQYVQSICQVRAMGMWGCANVKHIKRKTAMLKLKSSKQN
jgi:hypothetical protein